MRLEKLIQKKFWKFKKCEVGGPPLAKKNLLKNKMAAKNFFFKFDNTYAGLKKNFELKNIGKKNLEKFLK